MKQIKIMTNIVSQESKLPVLLVHGLDDTGARMQHIRRALQQAGWSSVELLTLEPNDGSASIERMAAQVAHAAQSLRMDTEHAAIDIVGFSMGGVVSRYMIQRMGGHAFVRRFITLSTPHHGTITAYFRAGAGIQQMRPGSALLRDLNTASWGATKVFSYWTPFDLMIVPAWSSALPDAVNSAIPVLSHPWMTSDRRVMRTIIQTLSMGTAA
jgi:triacylglycerol lipase